MGFSLVRFSWLLMLCWQWCWLVVLGFFGFCIHLDVWFLLLVVGLVVMPLGFGLDCFLLVACVVVRFWLLRFVVFCSGSGWFW